MTALYLVRHGRTDWNDEGRYQGQCDPPLNHLGRQQAREVARGLRDVRLAAIYSSDLRRAQQTAQALGKLTGLPVHLEPRLREIDLGAWAGQLVSTIRTAEPELFARWRGAPASARPPAGETVPELAARIVAVLDDIARTHPDAAVAVFTHGAAIAAVRCLVGGLPLDHIWIMLLENASWEVVQWPAPR
jgi:broad specificity phosphatase PhoE